MELETIAQVQPPAKVTQPDVGNDAVTVRSLIILFLKSVFTEKLVNLTLNVKNYLHEF